MMPACWVDLAFCGVLGSLLWGRLALSALSRSHQDGAKGPTPVLTPMAFVALPVYDRERSELKT